MPEAAHELELIKLRAKLYPLLEELEITGRIRDQMLDDPLRALKICQHAKGQRGLTNPAAFAVSRWQKPAREPAPEPEHEPMTIADLHGAVSWLRSQNCPDDHPAMIHTQAALKIAHERGHWVSFTEADRERFGLAPDPE